MEIILSTAFGVKAETQTVENDPITELAKKAMAPHPIIGIMCRDLTASFKTGQFQRDYPVIQSFKLSLFSHIKLQCSQTGYGAHFLLKDTLVIYALYMNNIITFISFSVFCRLVVLIYYFSGYF